MSSPDYFRPNAVLDCGFPSLESNLKWIGNGYLIGIVLIAIGFY
jgi:hypothetical protein